VKRAAWLLEPPGLIPYAVANDAMHELADRRLAGEIPDVVLLLEHPHVFTAGRRAKPDELLWSPEELEARGAEVHRIDRGGSFTHHGPGQLVAYPVLDLGTTPDAMRYVRSLEEVVIRTGRDLGVELERRTDVQTGVWRGDDKVCAIGVRLMRARITMHGFAINCDNDLSWFNGIVACGLPRHGVTSLTELAGRHVGVEEARTCVKHHVASVFGLAFEPGPQDVFAPPVPAR
jgi:lipoyl(octanoyl) transferase